MKLSPEVEGFIDTKKSSRTKYVYRRGFKHFLLYYRDKHGKDSSIKDFINSVDRSIGWSQPL